MEQLFHSSHDAPSFQFDPEDCCCIQICAVGTKAMDVIDVCLFEIVHDAIYS